MAVTELHPRPALIVVDLQVGTVANPSAHPADGIVERVGRLAAAFRARSLPVVVATVTGTPTGRTSHGGGGRRFPPEWSRSVPGLEIGARDILIERATWSAFAATDLDPRLRELGTTQVVLVGLATSFGIESTARQAYDLGYHVVVVSDAVTDPSLAAHTARITQVFPALGEITLTGELLEILDRS